MPIRRFVSTLLLAGGVLLNAQDASMVLRTSVTYRTQRNSLPLDDAQKQEADKLMAEANQAEQAGNHREAIHDMYHGLAVMNKVPWTPEYEFAASLQGKLDHAVVDPASRITVTLSPLYDTKGAKLPVAVVLVPRQKGSGTEAKLSTATIDRAAIPYSAKVALPADTTGDYGIEVRLSPEGEPATGAARVGLTKALPIHIEALSASAQKLRDRIAKSTKRSHPAMASAEYAVALYDRADHGDANPNTYKFADEFAKANAILDVLEAGGDPFAGKRGDFHKAYRSAVDDSLQPYRVLIPSTYDGSKATPLVIALHGMGGDENSMFDSYNGVMKREAERVGFIVACPKGRDTASMYVGSAERDVLDVLAAVRRDYKVDPGRIYLMGHSMGGYGTWSIAMAHPEIFAALGPISGGGNPAGMAKIAHIPQYVVHGDDDRTVPVTQSRVMVDAGKKAGANIVYVEIPGGSHTAVAAPQFGAMLDFFAKQKRSEP
jgi:pimeloyl-ACP methyl ester carboxylesterase